MLQVTNSMLKTFYQRHSVSKSKQTIIQYTITQHNTMQCITTQHNTTWPSITQHNTTKYLTTQHNITQQNTPQKTQHTTPQQNKPLHDVTQYNNTTCNKTQHNVISCRQLNVESTFLLKIVLNVLVPNFPWNECLLPVHPGGREPRGGCQAGGCLQGVWQGGSLVWLPQGDSGNRGER